jgi:site-specific recombinase XerD
VAGWLAAILSDYSRETAKAYDKSLRLFREWLAEGGETLQSVTPVLFRNWRDHLIEQGYSVSTVNLWLSGVRSFYRWLVEQNMTRWNPTEGVKGASRRGKSRRHKREELTSSEVQTVLDTCEDSPDGRRDRAIIALMAYCALRTVEVQRADLGDLQTRDGRKVLWVRGKGHAEADDFVVLPVPAEVAVQAWLAVQIERVGTEALFVSVGNRSRGRRLTRTAIRHMVKRRFREAGVDNGRKTTHSLRHSAISSAIRNGAEPIQVQAMARHKSFDTTLGYYHEIERTSNPAEDLVSYSSEDSE